MGNWLRNIEQARGDKRRQRRRRLVEASREERFTSKLDYRRPNLLHKKRWYHFSQYLFLFLFARRSDGPATTRATIDVLLLFLSRFQNLIGRSLVSKVVRTTIGWSLGLTWKEHSKLSSTLIMAPALSNSPQ